MKPAGLRIMHSFAFRRADAPWLGGVGAGYGLECSRMPRDWHSGKITRGNLPERPPQHNVIADPGIPLTDCCCVCSRVVGWPEPGDPYWTVDTLHGVAEHYPGIDLSPYSVGVLMLGSNTAQELDLVDGEQGMLTVEREALPPLDKTHRWHFEPETEYLSPEAAAFSADGSDGPLSAAQVNRFEREGLLLLDGLFPVELVAEAAEAAQSYGQLGGQYPYSDELECFNTITLHPHLLTAASQLLQGETDLRIYNAHSMNKEPSDAPHGEQPDFAPGEQGLHQVCLQTLTLSQPLVVHMMPLRL